MESTFHIGISADLEAQAPGRLEPALGELVDPLPGVTYSLLDPSGVDAQGSLITPSDIEDMDAVLALSPRFTAESFSGHDRLIAIARWGVGYDQIDVDACTSAGVLLAITVDAVRRPVAEAVVTFVLALAKCMFEKDRIVRQGRWDLRGASPAVGLRGKALGMVGLGNIGSEVFRLLEPFGLGRKMAHDPYADKQVAGSMGIELVDLETVFRDCDFVSVNALLNDETRGMIDARLLNMMKPTAYLINTARGPIVNQDDLVAVLRKGGFAGAGLDVFEHEPLPADHPLTTMENVILAPHSLAWIDDVYRDNTVHALQNILTVLMGEVPKHTVNRSVIDQPAFQRKLDDLRNRWSASQAVRDIDS